MRFVDCELSFKLSTYDFMEEHSKDDGIDDETQGEKSFVGAVTVTYPATTMLAGAKLRNKSDSHPDLPALGISYKVQNMSQNLCRTKGTVQKLLEKEIYGALADRMFLLLVIKPLKIDEISDLAVST
jgi:translation initiation factor RLI1